MARSKRWVVDDTSPRDLAGVLAAMGAGADALAQGRVFVGRVRAERGSLGLRAGDVVEVFEAAAAGGAEATVLGQRDGMLAMHKPAGLPTVPDHRGSERTLLAAAAKAAGVSAEQLHPTSRLDREVSGVVLFAVSAEARVLLKEAREHGRYQRHYVAIASNAPSPAGGTIDAPIGRGADPRRRAVGGKEAVASATRYETIATSCRAALLAVEPVTGRTHQIRVHMAHAGASLVGDDLYGGSRAVVLHSGAVRRMSRVALHAAWVQVQMPNGRSWKVEAPVPEDLGELWRVLGGEHEAWTRALLPL
jgi:23S rRNA pseudouridine1911/1915/1917 synthase